MKLTGSILLSLFGFTLMLGSGIVFIKEIIATLLNGESFTAFHGGMMVGIGNSFATGAFIILFAITCLRKTMLWSWPYSFVCFLWIGTHYTYTILKYKFFIFLTIPFILGIAGYFILFFLSRRIKTSLIEDI